MKLISMTDFALYYAGNMTYKDHSEKCTKYARFLKQPLTLGMFVPCDEEGDVLEEPAYKDCEKYENPLRTYEGRLRKHQQAKENVLFEGFESKELPERISFFREGRCIITYSFTKDDFLGNSPTIERVSGFDLTLTANAIKQIES